MRPNKPTSGLVTVSGAKNSCLPLIVSSILFNDQVVLRNVSFVQDVYTMLKLIKSLDLKYIFEKQKLVKIVNSKAHKLVVPYKLVSTMRAGVLTMGPLLSRYQNKKIFVKRWGCSIGI